MIYLLKIGQPCDNSVLLRSRRWLAAFHHRQLVDSLRADGVALLGELDVEGFEDLDPAQEIY